MILFTRRFKHFFSNVSTTPWASRREVTTHHKLSVSVSRGCVGANGVTDGPTGGQCQRVPEINKWKTKRERRRGQSKNESNKERETEREREEQRRKDRHRERKRKESEMSDVRNIVSYRKEFLHNLILFYLI